MPVAGSIGAQVFTEFRGDVNLALIRDTNNNGIVDGNEILASAKLASSGAKELSKPLAAGNYFLRVSLNDMSVVSKYFLSFQTDFAGSTTATARNVGTLSGTLGFDDWASGPFSGAINDTSDLYKFTLASAKTFTAKMNGKLSGQDLDLQLFVDKNHDGKLTADELVASSKRLDTANEQITKA